MWRLPLSSAKAKAPPAAKNGTPAAGKPDPPRLPVPTYLHLPKKSSKYGPECTLDDETANKILAALRLGCYRDDAARFARRSTGTFDTWLKRKGEPYETFQLAVEEAEAYGELNMLNAVQFGSYWDPKVAIAFLERRYPEKYGRVLTVPPGGTNVFNFNLGDMLERVVKRVEGGKLQRALPGGRIIAGDGQPRDPRPPKPKPVPDDDEDDDDRD